MRLAFTAEGVQVTGSYPVLLLKVSFESVWTLFVVDGKAAEYEQLKQFLSNEAAEGAYAAPAKHLGLSTGAVAVFVHRLRKRYGELVREEIAHTVTSPGEIEDELSYLLSLAGR